jgi:predicted porin
MTYFTSRKTLLAAAAAVAGLSNAAHADTTLGDLANLKVDTTIYGFLNGQLESVQATGGATPYNTRGRVSDGNSRLGFRGNIGVTDDLKGIWQLEASLNNFDQGGVNTRGESSSLSSRNSYVGLESKRFGTFVVGNNDSVYRSLIGSGGEFGGNLGLTVHGLDVWNNTSAQMTGNADSVFSRGEARYKNTTCRRRSRSRRPAASRSARRTASTKTRTATPTAAAGRSPRATTSARCPSVSATTARTTRASTPTR